MTYLVVIVDFVAFKKGFFMSSYTDNLKQENDQLKRELAELKASIPRQKRDAIRDLVSEAFDNVRTDCRCGVIHDYDMFALNYANEIITQANTGKE